MITVVKPIIDYSVRGLCVKPYYNHHRGCPNFNKKEGCPPAAKLYDKVYDLSQPVFAIVNTFDLKEHMERMKRNNPAWTERQLKCCLYWQPKARKELEKKIKQFLEEHGTRYKIETCPEAMGINLIETMKQVGIQLVWPPEDVVYQIALAGIRRDESI